MPVTWNTSSLLYNLLLPHREKDRYQVNAGREKTDWDFATKLENGGSDVFKLRFIAILANAVTLNKTEPSFCLSFQNDTQLE